MASLSLSLSLSLPFLCISISLRLETADPQGPGIHPGIGIPFSAVFMVPHERAGLLARGERRTSQ